LYSFLTLHPRCITIVVLLMIAGCATSTPVNPSFPISPEHAREILTVDSTYPRPLKRPLVIIGGFLDPGIAQLVLTHDFKQYTHDNRIIGVSLGLSFDPDVYRKLIIEAVDKAFPATDPIHTTEVDVIGYSMGGLAARYSAITPAPGRRLKIARLFTVASPHRGARTVEQIPFNLVPLQKQMRPGSAFLNSINNSADPGGVFPVYSYVVLGDRVVGASYASPPGQNPWWVSAPVFPSSHDDALFDPRIRADILSRLRGDDPLSHDPPTPLPPIKAQTAPR
jgi:pimeloyl-ACP methyl ester carboxylesterase